MFDKSSKEILSEARHGQSINSQAVLEQPAESLCTCPPDSDSAAQRLRAHLIFTQFSVSPRKSGGVQRAGLRSMSALPFVNAAHPCAALVVLGVWRAV